MKKFGSLMLPFLLSSHTLKERKYERKTKRYCGACSEEFKSKTDFMKHINQCKAAKVLLPVANTVFFEKLKGHELARKIILIRDSIPKIKTYARVVVHGADNLARINAHKVLCDSLEVAYKDFKPFESEKIKIIPDLEEAEQIIWNAIEKEIIKVYLKEKEYE